MKQAAKVGLHLLQNEKPHSSVSYYIDSLCSSSYKEEDLDGIIELVESINLQSTGPTEASRAIRKKLKYSNVHGQLRVLTILKALVENCGPSFQVTFANERLVDRIKLMAGDPTCDERVKKKLMSVLASWYRLFKEDRNMQLVAGLYLACGGGSGNSAGKKVVSNQASDAYQSQQARYEREASERTERKLRERKEKEKERERLEKEKEERKNKGKPKVKRIPFNFEAEKPKIMATVAQASQSSQNLINALQHVNREKESVTTNERVIECLAKAKADRKIVVRYIQQVENDTQGDYIGTLLSTNESILSALALYDRYSKPVDLDSDDEHISTLQKVTTPITTSNPYNSNSLFPKDYNNNDDTFSIRSKLSAFDIRDGEMDKLQERQWRGVDRENRSRAARVHPDLQDLAFGPVGSGSSLPPPIQPNSQEYSHGSLAEYSDGTDYSSSDDGEIVSGLPPTSFSSSAFASGSGSGLTTTGEDAKSYARYIQKDNDNTGGIKTKGLLEPDDDEDDPFADPGDDEEYGYEASVQDNKRRDWREV